MNRRPLMKRSLMLAALASACLGGTALAALGVGDAAPDFTLAASQAGHPFQYSLSEQLKKGPVVVYFYPAAYTGGCSIQARSFAVNHEKFTAAGASVVGISQDRIERLNEFSADPEYCAGKVAVASDAEGKVSKAFNLVVKQSAPGRTDQKGVAILHASVERTTFIVAPDGKVAAVLSDLPPAANVAQSLQAVQALAQT